MVVTCYAILDVGQKHILSIYFGIDYTTHNNKKQRDTIHVTAKQLKNTIINSKVTKK